MIYLRCISSMREELLKIKNFSLARNTHEWFLEDAKAHLSRQDDHEWKTTQCFIGHDKLFRGWIMKNLENVNIESLDVMGKCNKIIVKKSVTFYSKVWCARNELFHDPSKYRHFVIEWYERIIELVRNSNKPHVKRYVQTQKLDVIRSENSLIRKWCMGTLEMLEQSKEEQHQDIRQFFRVK